MRKLFFISLWMLLSIQLFAFQVKLADNTIIIGQSLVKSMVIKNTSNKPIAVQVSPKKRAYAVDGQENFTEDSDDLILIPPQFIIGPLDEEVVTIRWAGELDFIDEKPFRIVVENIPIPNRRVEKFEKPSASIDLSFQFVNSFYVSQPKAKSNVVIDSVSPDKDSEALNIVFNNRGTKHEVVRSMVLNIDGRKSNQSVTSNVLGIGINFLPKEKRQITLPITNFNDFEPSKNIEVKIVDLSDVK